MVGNTEKQRRYSLRIALSTLVISLLVFAVGGTVGIILAVRSRSLSVVSETIQKEVSLRIGNKLLDRFESAEILLQEYMRLGERGLIPLEDPDALSERLAERIRYDSRYEWLAFVQCDGTGAGAVRAIDGRIVLHKVPPLGGGFDLSREVVNEDGTKEPLAPVSLEDADFRKSPWYTVGIQNAEPTWVKRYVRQVDGTYGWACAVSIDRGGRRVGVLGVGFGLAFIEDYLKDISVAKSGRVFLLNALTGEVRIGPSSDEVARLRPVIAGAIAALPLGVKSVSVGETVSASVQHGGLRYIVAFETQRLRAGAAWINALVIPEEEVIGFANRYLAIGLSGIGLIFVIGLILAVKISRGVSSPLTVISDDLERVGEFELSPRPMPRSMIEEIAIVGDSVDRMKASLRSFGRYVPTDLVRGLLSEGQEARLGGKVKRGECRYCHVVHELAQRAPEEFFLFVLVGPDILSEDEGRHLAGDCLSHIRTEVRHDGRTSLFAQIGHNREVIAGILFARPVVRGGQLGALYAADAKPIQHPANAVDEGVEGAVGG